MLVLYVIRNLVENQLFAFNLQSGSEVACLANLGHAGSSTSTSTSDFLVEHDFVWFLIDTLRKFSPPTCPIKGSLYLLTTYFNKCFSSLAPVSNWHITNRGSESNILQSCCLNFHPDLFLKLLGISVLALKLLNESCDLIQGSNREG